jgi:hypothetical protein
MNTPTNILAGLTRGKQQRAQRVCIYGVESVGKTTLASNAPSPIFLDVEGGTHHIDAARVEINSYDALRGALAELLAGGHSFKSVVIDSADWTEKLLIEDLLATSKKQSIEDWGYGKGWVQVAERFARLLTGCDKLIEQGINVLFIAHSQVKRVEPPDQMAAYDRYELKLSKQCSPLLKEWSDELWFAQFKTKVVESESGRMKGKGGKERVLYTTHSAAYDAKTRSGLPEELPMAWAGVAHIFTASEGPAPKAESPKADGPKEPEVKGLHFAVIRALGKGYDMNDAEGYMLHIGRIEAGQSWMDASEQLLERISENPEGFKAKVQEWKGSK